VWTQAHNLVPAIYRLTAAFPKHKTFGLAFQFRRGAISVPANIAGGYRRLGKFDKARYLNIAEGSLEECRYYLLLTHDLGHADTTQPQTDLEEVSRLLAAYVRAIRESAH
jgi:four helix bundle protein